MRNLPAAQRTVSVPPRTRKPAARKLAVVPTPAALAGEVRKAVEAAPLRAEDAATAALAVQLAATIDRAADLAAAVAALPFDPDAAGQVERLAKRVEAHTVMADLGPKLLAALGALHCTPAARANVKGATPAPPGLDQLAALRAGKLGAP